ncbi:MAG: cytochrome P450 [Pseudonocardiales bacterium]|nr:MAG: cytochrome P450 [Pseudonocardiales bacterium]
MAIDSRESDHRAAAVPGDGGLPLLGYTAQFISGKLTTSRERYDRYGPVSWIRVFGLKVVTAQGPDACGEVLQNRSHAFGSGAGWSFLIGPFFRRGLMLLDFEEHHLHRRIMQQAFTSDRLAGYLEPMNTAIADGMARWPAGGEIRVYPTVKQLTLDVATRTFMGAQLDVGADRLNTALVDCVRAGTAAVRFPVPGLRWARGLAGRTALERFLYPHLPAKRAGDAQDLFSALCHARGEGGEQFTDHDIVNHMIFLLMAAHDTSTITLTSMAYYLAKHPEWQERCRAESRAVGTPTLGYDDIDKLVSLDLVMKESMRLITPVPGVMRKTVRDTELMGHFVPADTYVSVNLYGVHHLEEYWPDPERFDPGRFAHDRREDKVHRNAWMPFGNGVHKCIGLHFAGMEIKAAMHQLLLGYRWSVPADYQIPLDWSSLPRPKDGLPVQLEQL